MRVLVALVQLSTAWAVGVGKHPVPVKKYQVDLAEPALTRWNHLFTDPLFNDAAASVHSYFASLVPSWILPIIEDFAKHMRSHFPEEYADEIEGIANAAKSTPGDITLVNLAYSLEEIGNTNCTMNNVTGPCLPKKDFKPRPGLCTSTVAEGSDGNVWLARNLDWDLKDVLRKYVIDVEFVNGSASVFTCTTIIGLVGCLHGLRPDGYAISMNARNKGGNAIVNLLDWMTRHDVRTAAHLLRQVLQNEAEYPAAIKALSTTEIDAPVYYIVAGANKRDGAIVTRERQKAIDTWSMGSAPNEHPSNNTQPDWFRLQTNYDHWEEVPVWDDRRHPGISYMTALGNQSLSSKSLMENILSKFPVFNPHTDITAVMSPKSGEYYSIVWRDDKPTEERAIYI